MRVNNILINVKYLLEINQEMRIFYLCLLLIFTICKKALLILCIFLNEDRQQLYFYRA